MLSDSSSIKEAALLSRRSWNTAVTTSVAVSINLLWGKIKSDHSTYSGKPKNKKSCLRSIFYSQNHLKIIIFKSNLNHFTHHKFHRIWPSNKSRNKRKLIGKSWTNNPRFKKMIIKWAVTKFNWIRLTTLSNSLVNLLRGCKLSNTQGDNLLWTRIRMWC